MALRNRQKIAFLLVVLVVAVPFSYMQASKGQSSFSKLDYIQTLYTANSSLLQYVSLYDGYLWVVGSRATSFLNKYNDSTDALVASALINRTWGESYSAYVYGGVVYVTGFNTAGGYIETFNESTLAEINWFSMPSDFCLRCLRSDAKSYAIWRRG